MENAILQCANGVLQQLKKIRYCNKITGAPEFSASFPKVWTRQTSCKQYSPTSSSANHTNVLYVEGLLNAKLGHYQLQSIGLCPISHSLLECIELQVNN
jgi:hypothetical protein